MKIMDAVMCAALGLGAPAARAAKVTTIYDIPGVNDGGAPRAALLHFRGAFWGTTSGGGTGNSGTVFKIDPGRGTETLVYQFTGGNDGGVPAAPLIAVDGVLYGTTAGGGTSGSGTVFRIDPATGAETVLYSFPATDEGAAPTSALLAYDGLLYGTAQFGGADADGYVFAVDPATGAETTIYSFQDNNDGAFPTSALIRCGGALCGTTSQGGAFGLGTLYRLDPVTGDETVLHSFGASGDGGVPLAPPIDVDGVMYGTLSFGGAQTDGAVFAFDMKRHAETIIYNFTGGKDGSSPAGGLLRVNGVLYGTAATGGSGRNGTVFAIDPSSGSETTLHDFRGQDGSSPVAAVIESGGMLYGTAESGGPTQNGVVFAVDPATARDVTLHDFAGTQASQAASVGKVGGVLYGTSSGGGNAGVGSIFRVDPKTGTGETLYSFVGGPDGAYPFAPLLDAGGTLYGTTRNGGAANEGTVFRFDAATKTPTTIYSFTGGADGGYIYGGLIDVAGLLYGTAYDGGASNNGTVFSIDPATGAETTLYSFAGGQDGALPYSGVVYANGMLYGTTLAGGGKGNYGTVFQVDPATGAETLLHVFTGGRDGSAPFAGLLYDRGVLYGATTGCCGSDTDGSVFKIDIATGQEAVLHRFAVFSGPQASLIRDGDALYGTTPRGGKFHYGTVFSINPATGAFAKLYNFTGQADGGLPSAALVDVRGTLYGTAPSLFPTNAGTVFRLGR